jgi:hypothetical protein
MSKLEAGRFLAPKTPSPPSFLVVVWAKSDFGFALFEEYMLDGDKPAGWNRTGHILANLLVAESIELCGAGAHDVVRRGDILLGTAGIMSKQQ